MDAVEFALKILPFNDALPQELAKLEAEGWQGIPNLAPAVSYVMFRPAQIAKPEPRSEREVAGFVQMTVDDSKIHVVKGKTKAA